MVIAFPLSISAINRSVSVAVLYLVHCLQQPITFFVMSWRYIFLNVNFEKLEASFETVR